MTVSRPSRTRLCTEITAYVLLFAMTMSLLALLCAPSRLADPDASATPPLLAATPLPRTALDRVNYLYGEADDYATECFRLGTSTYLVGSTASHLYDYTSPLHGTNLFVALFDGDTLTRVKVWGTDGNDACIAAALTDGGLCVLTQNDRTPSRATVYTVSFTSLDATAHTLLFPEPVTPTLLYADGTDTVVCAQSADGLTLHVSVTQNGTARTHVLTYPDATLAASAIYPSPRGYVLLATAYGSDGARPV